MPLLPPSRADHVAARHALAAVGVLGLGLLGVLAVPLVRGDIPIAPEPPVAGSPATWVNTTHTVIGAQLVASFVGQQQAPCRRPAVEIYGACWRQVAEGPVDGDCIDAHHYQGKCYLPILAEPKPAVGSP